MLKSAAAPATLREAIHYFADKDFAHNFFTQLRWPNGVICPACEGTDVAAIKSRRIWQCRECRRQFSAKLGTVFEDSPIGLEKWLPALWLLVNAKNGISSYELHRALGVTQKTAWFMLGRIRLSMQAKSFSRFSGEVEIDESFIGGAAKFMHKSKKDRVIKGTGGMNKTAVMGILKRGKNGKSRVQAGVVHGLKKRRLQAIVHAVVKHGAKVYTDAFWSYRGLGEYYVHQVIDHAHEYVRGRIHTNGLENFWSLLKRTIKGTYVNVDPFHLHRYVTEQVHRYNQRELNDGERFLAVLRGIVGKRLTYRDLTGADLNPATT
jgi:transposase-like protein